MKSVFTEWFGTQISEALGSGKAPEVIDITLKPLQAKWIEEPYDEMISESGKNLIWKGWKKSGITDGIKVTSSKLPSLDPFDQFNLLGKDQDKYDLMTTLSINEGSLGERITKLSGRKSEWGWSKWW